MLTQKQQEQDSELVALRALANSPVTDIRDAQPGGPKNEAEYTTNLGGQYELPPEHEVGDEVEPTFDGQKIEPAVSLQSQILQDSMRNVGSSTWETLLFVYLPGHIGVFDSCMLLLGVLTNIVLQGLFVAIAFEEFTQVPLLATSDAVHAARKWRLTVAHSTAFMDKASWMSLASLVCADDMTLITSANQLSLLADINTYLGPAPLPLLGDDSGFKVGPLLLSVVMTVWLLSITRDVFQILEYVEATLSLPRASISQLKISADGKFELASSTLLRIVAVLIVSLIRFVVASLLGYIGVMWLVNTASLSDLVLNAAAMAFILDLDELVFDNLTPISVQVLLENVEPLQMLRMHVCCGIDIRPLTVLAFTACCLVWFLSQDVDFMTRRMAEVRYELCERGSLQFVVEEHSQLGLPIAVWTNPAGKELDSSADTAYKQAVAGFIELPVLENGTAYKEAYASGGPLIQEHQSYYSQSWPGLLVFSKSYFDAYMALEPTQMLAPSDCMDLLGGEHEYSTWKMISDGMLLATQFEYQDFIGKTCSDFVKDGRCSAETANGLRFLCAQTCGCTFPRSSMFLDRRGCWSPCLTDRYENLMWYKCEDVSVEVLRADEAVKGFLTQVGWGDELFARISSALMNEGCELLSEEAEGGKKLRDIYPAGYPKYSNILCGRGAYMASSDPLSLGQSSLRPWCPVSCGCRESHNADCPESCKPNSTFDLTNQDCTGGLCRGSRLNPETYYTPVFVEEWRINPGCLRLDSIIRDVADAHAHESCKLLRASDNMAKIKEICCV